MDADERRALFSMIANVMGSQNQGDDVARVSARYRARLVASPETWRAEVREECSALQRGCAGLTTRLSMRSIDIREFSGVERGGDQ